MRRFITYLIDLGLITAASVAAVFLREDFEYSVKTLIATLPHIGFTLLFASAVLPVLGRTNSMWRHSVLRDYLRILAAVLAIVACASVASFIYNRLDGVPRSVPILQALLIVFAMVGARVIRHMQYAASQTQPDDTVVPHAIGASQETVLIVGATVLAELYVRSITQIARGRIRVEGLLTSSVESLGSPLQRLPILGKPDDVETVLRNLEIHGVAIQKIVVTTAFEQLSPKAQQAILQIEASTAIEVQFVAEQLGLEKSSRNDRMIEPDTVDPLKTHFNLPEREIHAINSGFFWRLKRKIDIVVAAALIVVTFPLMVIVGLLVAIDVGLPVIFWQQRPGRGGLPFRLYKFRTMAAAHDSQGRRINDNLRISHIGRLLRRTRLDELPQLFSILTGDMSFVGPRPLLAIDQAPEFSARLLVRPGLTGWAQVNGGREVSATDKAAMDIWYVCNASVALDLKILLHTIPMVLFGDRTRHRNIQATWRDLSASGICSRPGGMSATQQAA